MAVEHEDEPAQENYMHTRPDGALYEIVDAEAELVEKLLAWIYTGVLESGSAINMLGLAHKYQMNDLIAECCQQLQILILLHLTQICKTTCFCQKKHTVWFSKVLSTHMEAVEALL